MISGGLVGGGESTSARKSYLRQIHIGKDLRLMTVERPKKHHKSECLTITFSAEDARGVSQPHDDPLVVSLVVSNYLTRRILIDNGSLADILYLLAFDQMGIDRDKLKPVRTPLVGFTGDRLLPIGMIRLPVVAGTGEYQATQEIDFLVVDCPSAYDGILGRPGLNRFKAIMSTYHLQMSFPMEKGIGEVRGNQVIARECYMASLKGEPSSYKENMLIEGLESQGRET